MDEQLTEHNHKMPSAFIWRRLHSLTGLFLVIYLIEHLVTNSQAALWLGENGKSFVDAVNSIQKLPYLHAIEIFLIGLPFLIHGIWGIKYALTSKPNSLPSDGSKPSLTEYPRNHFYSLQRWSSWIILFGVILHVIQMRFIEYPTGIELGGNIYHMARISQDNSLFPLAARLDVKLYDKNAIEEAKRSFETSAITHEQRKSISTSASSATQDNLSSNYQSIFPNHRTSDDSTEKIAGEEIEKLYKRQKKAFIDALERKPIGNDEFIAVTDNFGTAELLILRETFKNPVMVALYTVFVLASSFHAFNGLWTFLITWGVNITKHVQDTFFKISIGLMSLLAFMGLAAIWGSYWIVFIY